MSDERNGTRADTTTSLQEMAALHAACFAPADRWTAAMLGDTLAQKGSFAVATSGGFALGRVTADEAELLTLVVEPAWRRRGVGSRLLQLFEDGARLRGADAAFLEVAEDNAPARALYARMGWTPVGRRRAYYGAADALVLRRAF